MNNKQVKEEWDKNNIERWMPTTKKISDILPSILGSTKIEDESFWSDFKNLEHIRNEIIHQKTILDGDRLDLNYFTKLVMPDIFKKIKSAVAVIKFFYKLNNSHPYFPLGLGIAKPHIKEVDDLDTFITSIEKVN